MASNTAETNSNLSDINILLMGPTGVGKTTFINALANYLKFGCLQEAEAGEMEVLIPSSFSLSGTGVGDQFEDHTITVGGAEDNYEHFSPGGQSSTQLCRSFTFPIGNRLVRLIDTPGIGDTEGLQKDSDNLQDMLAFIDQYEHVNAICILAKPNEERLTVPFQYCVKELLRHLDLTAKENLMFIFTNARSTFYRPGKTKKLLEAMFTTHREKYNVEISINLQNTFVFDSEAFRYLAIRKEGYELDDSLAESYKASWERSVKECLRLLKYIVQLPPHQVQRTVSLNKAQQLIQKLSRPIAETSRLIHENVQLVEEHKKRAGQDPAQFAKGIPQLTGQIRQLKRPRTLCASEKCVRIVEKDGAQKIEYTSICHDQCYLKGVVQERLRHPGLEDCEVMNPMTGNCYGCGCHWTEHIHITYEYVADTMYYRKKVKDVRSAAASEPSLTLEDANERIQELKQEAAQMHDVYKRLVDFLQENAMWPINDGLIDYLDYFMKEAQTKQSIDPNSQAVIAQLQRMRDDHKSHLEQLQNALKERDTQRDPSSSLTLTDAFHLVKTLYALPISGKNIAEQVQVIDQVDKSRAVIQERRVEVSSQSNSAHILQEMKQILGS